MGDKNTPKLPVISRELKDAVIDYQSAIDHREFIRPTVMAYRQEVVEKSNLRYAPEYAPEYTGVIPDYDTSWMMEDEQADKFYKALDAARNAAGFTGYETSHCPLKEADIRVFDAKIAICREAEYITGVTASTARKHRDLFGKYVSKIIELVVSMHPELEKME